MSNLFGQIEKWMSEHGSASVLRDHVNLLKEQYTSLEKENVVLKEENRRLQNKQGELACNLDKAHDEITALSETIRSFRPRQDAVQLDDVTERILFLFFDTAKEMTIHAVAATMSLDAATTEYHFDILMARKLIIQVRSDFNVFSGEGWAFYSLTPAGRAHVVNKRRDTRDGP